MKWIDARKRKPAVSGFYIVNMPVKSGPYVCEAWFNSVSKEWTLIGMKIRVSHWQPIPKPPKKGRK